MKFEIYEMMANVHAELLDASATFSAKNSDESVKVWKLDEYLEAKRLFENAIRAIQELETFFSDGDEILPEAEHERLEREFLEEIAEG